MSYQDIFTGTGSLEEFDKFRRCEGPVVDELMINFAKTLTKNNFKVSRVWSYSNSTIKFAFYSCELPSQDWAVKFYFEGEKCSCVFMNSDNNELIIDRVLQNNDEVFFVPDWSYSHFYTLNECILSLIDLEMDSYRDYISEETKKIESARQKKKELRIYLDKLDSLKTCIRG